MALHLKKKEKKIAFLKLGKKKKVFSNSNAMGVFKNKNVFFFKPQGVALVVLKPHDIHEILDSKSFIRILGPLTRDSSL